MITLLITLFTVGIATVWDLITIKIPNTITFSAILAGMAINIYYSGSVGLANTVLGTAAGLMLLILPFAAGGIGAGDVKLLAAVGAMNGPRFVVEAFLFSAIAGGLIALIIVIYKRRFTEVVNNIKYALFNLPIYSLTGGISTAASKTGADLKFPYGIAILMGTLGVYILR